MSATRTFSIQATTELPCAAFQEAAWYAAQTRSRHERLVAYHLEARKIDQYLPTITETHVWSDRRKRVEVPLFPGYVFVHINATNERRVEILKTPGVVRFVGSNLGGTPIPAEQIESVRTLIGRNIPWAPYPFLKSGQRVRVRNGALEGVEGIFVKRIGANSLVISVDAIQRSLCVSIQGYALDVL